MKTIIIRDINEYTTNYFKNNVLHFQLFETNNSDYIMHNRISFIRSYNKSIKFKEMCTKSTYYTLYNGVIRFCDINRIGLFIKRFLFDKLNKYIKKTHQFKLLNKYITKYIINKY